MDITTQQTELFPAGSFPEGAELLMSTEQQRVLYPLKTIEKNKARLDGICALLAMNAPKNYIMKTFGVGWYTLKAIAESRGDKITDIKRRSAGKLAMFVELGAEQMLEDLQAGRLDPDKLPFHLKMVVDSMQLLNGDATVIFGASNDQAKRVTAQSLKEKLASMKRVDASVVDVTATGSGQPTISQSSGPTSETPQN